MVKVPDEVIQLIIRQGNIVEIASVDLRGVPNISPRYVMSILDDERLVFADAYINKTYANIKHWPKVTAAVVDKENRSGYQLKGDAEEINDPQLFNQCAKKLQELGFESGPVRIWTLNVKEIYSIKPGRESKNPLFSAYR